MTSESSQQLTHELFSENTRRLVDQVKQNLGAAEQLRDIADKVADDMRYQITRFALSLKTTTFKKEELKAFFDQPYYMYPVPRKNQKGELTGEVRKDAWHLVIPRWIDAAFGWLVSQTASFNVFLVNKYMDWLGELPGEVKKQLGWKEALDLKLVGDHLQGPKEAITVALQKYKPFIKRLDDQGILINPSRTFELLAALVKDGILPFTPKPVAAEDLVDPPRVSTDFGEKRDYQMEAWKKFLQYSNVGVFFPPSTGKTWIGMWAAASLKGPHLIVVPTRVIQDQWLARLKAHTTLKDGEDYVICTYQSAIRQHADGFKTKSGLVPWSLVVIDEVHHLPADWFSKLALIKKKYGIGLSASPFREDGREDFIFAFSGFPVGLGWEYFRKLGLIRKPLAQLWIVKDVNRKIARIGDLLKGNKRTVIFADGIDFGKSIAARFKIPHIYGDTKEDRIKLIEDAFAKEPYALVGSRVLDEGVSLPAIERIVEVDWLGASRRQELQRFTRLLHSKEETEGESHILMTENEYLRDHDRFYALYDKGFAVRVNATEVNEERLANRMRSGEVPIVRRTKPQKEINPEETSAAPAVSSTGVAGTLELPGIKKLLGSMTGSQQKFFRYLVTNDTKWFKAQSPVFYAGLGYSNYKAFDASVEPSKLVKRGLVEKGTVDGQVAYRTNMSS